MNELETVRDLDTITTEIRTITEQARCTMVTAAIEVGRRLVEAKAMVPRGEWGKYLEEKVEFSHSQANNMMRLYQEYGSSQESLFGGGVKKAIEGLSVTSAIRLLALPEEERETFVEENRVEEMSTRELEAAIKEKNAALEARKQAEADRESLSESLKSAKESEKKALSAVAEAEKSRAETARAEAEKAKQDLEAKAKNLEAKLKDAKAAVRQAEAEAKAAKENPDVPENVMEAIRAEAEAAVAEKAAQEAAARLAQAEKERAAAEERAKEASAALEEARKQAALSSPDAAVFKVVFTQVQEDFNRLLGTLKKITDPEMTEKLTAALEKLLETMGQRVRS